MTHKVISLWLSIGTAYTLGGSTIAHALPDDPSPVAINAAIDAGVRWLKSRQHADGSWGPCEFDRTYVGGSGGSGCRLGPTAFSVFALSTCGVPQSDQTIQRAAQWFRAELWPEERPDRPPPPLSSYESSAIVLMLTALNRSRTVPMRPSKRPEKVPRGSAFSEADWGWLHDNVVNICSCVSVDGGVGYWQRTASADVSATQFALLALRAAALEGYPIDRVHPAVWKDAARFLMDQQKASGGFAYRAGHEASKGMTAAALSTLAVCAERIAASGDAVPSRMGAATAKAWEYLAQDFDVSRNATESSRSGYYHYCYLYAVERAGILGARKEVGGVDWYLRGAAMLLDQQDGSGMWVDKTCIQPQGTLGTCFALLFLKKATIPVITSRVPDR